MTQNVIIRKPDLEYAYPGLITPAALTAGLIGAWMFNLKSGESQDAAAERCSYNRAAGASNAFIDRTYPGDKPTFFTNYARFRNDQLLKTNIPDWGSAGGCAFMVARTQDTNVGTSSPNRAPIIGTYGGNTNFGVEFQFSVYSGGTARAIDYNASGTIATNQLTTAANDLGKWRLYYLESGRASGGDALLGAENLNPADGSVPNPTPTTLTGGRSNAASQTFTIGGRISDSGSNYTASIEKDIAFILLFDDLPDTTEKTAIKQQCERICTRIGITLGS